MAIALGMTWGGYDTAQMVWTIELWEPDAAAYIQTQQFTFALGSFVSPLIVKSFLPEDSLQSPPGKLSPAETSTETTEVILESSAQIPAVPHGPFIICGLIPILSGLLLLTLYKIKKV